jgi:hypothetical protein
MVSLAEALSGTGNMVVLVKLLRYTAAMLVLPVAVLFLSSQALQTLFHWESDAATSAGAVLAVVLVQIIVFKYIVMAWREDEDNPQGAPLPEGPQKLAAAVGEKRKEE